MYDASELDQMVADSCRVAAENLAKTADVLGAAALRERAHQQPAIREAIASVFGSKLLVPSERLIPMPGWDGGGKLGGVDVLILDPATNGYLAMIELKWCHDSKTLGWTLWDIYK